MIVEGLDAPAAGGEALWREMETKKMPFIPPFTAPAAPAREAVLP
jgi:hypothetical protein